MAVARDNRGSVWKAFYSVDWQQTDRQMREGTPEDATHIVQVRYVKGTYTPTTEPYGATDLDECTFYVKASSMAEVAEVYPHATITALGKPAATPGSTTSRSGVDR